METSGRMGFGSPDQSFADEVCTEIWEAQMQGAFWELLRFYAAGQEKPSKLRMLSACKAAGVPGRILHDFRRTAVRNLERAGVSRSAAMAMVGHKTESIYRRYAIVEDIRVTDADIES